MRISLPDKRFIRVGLLVIVAVASYWLCSAKAETAERILPAAERPPMFVLQVGIGKYLNAPTWAELRGAVNDVVEMRKVLESDRYRIPLQNIVTLTDSQATKALIFERFQNHLIARAREHFEKTGNKDAVVMFQFSGHGSQAPDVDGDEKDDHKDETFVTYDSQDSPGKNYDITDDEIFSLTSELRRYTDNIVYIFDSCHSGSGTRDSQDVRRLPERKTLPVAVAGVGASTRASVTKANDAPGSGVLPPGDDYIVITAARSGELASQRNCFEECGSSTRPVAFGNLTFYLIDELKRARSDTSYRELMENVTRRVVSEKPTQTPQIEGDKSRFVFASLGSLEDSFTQIVGVDAKRPGASRTVKIRAGAMQGISTGTIVSFYDKAVTRFDTAEKLSSGSVIAVSPVESTVQLIGARREMTTDDKASIVAPDLGSLRLKANLEFDTSRFNAREKKIVSMIRDMLIPRPAATQGARGVDLVPASNNNWDVAVLKDKFSKVAAKIGGAEATCESVGTKAEETPRPEADVLYLAGKDFVPMFRFCIVADLTDETSQNAVATRISNALVHIARLKSINAISNRMSALSGKITVRPIRLTAPFGCENSRFKAAEAEPVIANRQTGNFEFQHGQVFWFEVTNNSSVDVYLALLNMEPNGSVKLFSPRERDDEKNGVLVVRNGGKRILISDECRVNDNGDIAEAGALLPTRLSGLDKFKLIVSVKQTTRDDFAYLEMPALTQRGAASPLVGMNDWTTVETFLQVNDTSQ